MSHGGPRQLASVSMFRSSDEGNKRDREVCVWDPFLGLLEWEGRIDPSV